MSKTFTIMAILGLMGVVTVLLNLNIGKGKPIRGSIKLGQIDSSHLEFDLELSQVAQKANFVVSVYSSNLSGIVDHCRGGRVIGQLILKSNTKERMIDLTINENSIGTWIDRSKPSIILNAKVSNSFKYINIDDVVKPRGCRIIIKLEEGDIWPNDSEIWLSFMSY